LAERQLPKLKVVGSRPITRSTLTRLFTWHVSTQFPLDGVESLAAALVY
jgi:hypothetical protein